MTDDTITMLRSIDASLKQLVAFAGARAQKATANADRLCDGPHGDPLVKGKDPKDWHGDPMTGRKFSECPPDYLDLWADRADYIASQKDASVPEQARKQKFELLDASRARAWAARLRAGWQAPVQAQEEGEPRW